MRTVARSLPALPNPGQYSVTGASRSSSPRLASTWAHVAVMPLVQEYTTTSVSASHAGASGSSALRPPQRSTTRSPSTVTHTEAPTSSNSSKLRRKASATASKWGWQVPARSTIARFCQLRAGAAAPSWPGAGNGAQASRPLAWPPVTSYGLLSLADLLPDPLTGEQLTQAERYELIIASAIQAEQA